MVSELIVLRTIVIHEMVLEGIVVHEHMNVLFFLVLLYDQEMRHLAIETILTVFFEQPINIYLLMFLKQVALHVHHYDKQ